MAKILVTGGAGFIGSHLVDALVAESHEVTVLDNLVSGSEKNLAQSKDKITLIKGDIRDAEILKKAVVGMEYVFHFAALASVQYSVENPLETHEVNSTGTLKVLIAARDAKVKRVICVSSASVYGDEPTLPKTESSPIKPLTPYALTKLSGERYAVMFYHLYGLETVTLRKFNVYGPRQDPSSPYSGVISKFVDKLKAGEQPVIFGDGSQTRDFIFVGDVVQANLKAMTAKDAAGKVFNIATGTQVTLNELLKTLNEVLGTSLEAKNESPRPGDIPHSVADVSAAKSVLGFEPKTSLREGLEKTTEE